MTTVKFKQDWRGRRPGTIDKIDTPLAELLRVRGMVEFVEAPKQDIIKRITNKLGGKGVATK